MRWWIDRLLRKRRTAIFALTAPVVMATVEGGRLGVLPAPPGERGARTPEQQGIESQPVCIGSSVVSAGDLGDVLYYRAVERGDGRISVGYFAFWSEERPWGNNWLTWSVLPALGVDMVYSRAFFVLPGLQRAMYGLGDVEGVSITYQRQPDGSLRAVEGTGDDRTERTVAISRDQMFALDPIRPTFYSDIWSHQLAGQSARSLKDLAYVRCYQGGAIRPLPDAVSTEFRVAERADPAHVERLGGKRLDVVEASDGALAATTNNERAGIP